MTLLLLGCGLYRTPPDLEVHTGGQDQVPQGVVGLVDAVLLSELEHSAQPMDSFRAGTYVGNVVMTGGYVVENSGEAGLQTMARETELNSVERYHEQVTDWVDESLGEVLDKRKRSWRRVELELPAPERRRVRGTHPADGTDNVNLPRFTLEPAPLGAPVEGVDLVLAPTVVLYYSHNAGWFVGQDMGCGAGARFRLLWTLYDARDGSVLGWRDIERRHIENYLFQPSSSQVDDLLIAVEEGVRKDLDRELLR